METLKPSLDPLKQSVPIAQSPTRSGETRCRLCWDSLITYYIAIPYWVKINCASHG